MADPPDFVEDAVDAELLLPADAIWPYRDFPKVFEMRIGVSYLTSEKLLDALVVIFVSQNKIIIPLIIYLWILRDKVLKKGVILGWLKG